MTQSAEKDRTHAERERIRLRLAQVRRSSESGDLIAGPEIGVAWTIALAEEVQRMLAEQEEYHLAMHHAYRPEVVAEIAVRLDEESDWEATAQWCGGTIRGDQDPSGEWTSHINIPGVGSVWQGGWITLDHAGQFHIRTEVAAPETTVIPPGSAEGSE